jgi:hypothetical protein
MIQVGDTVGLGGRLMSIKATWLCGVQMRLPRQHGGEDGTREPESSARPVANAAPRPCHERVALWCGCEMAVVRRTGESGAFRQIRLRGDNCRLPSHTVGARVYLWELLPPKKYST